MDAGVIVAVDTAVIKPFELTVITGTVLFAPYDPTLELTLAKIKPIEVAPEPVASPLIVTVWLAVRKPGFVPTVTRPN